MEFLKRELDIKSLVKIRTCRKRLLDAHGVTPLHSETNPFENGADLGSPVTSDRRFPISFMKAVASGPKVREFRQPQGRIYAHNATMIVQLGVYLFFFLNSAVSL